MIFPTGNFISSLDDAKEATELRPSFVKAVLNGEENCLEKEVAWMCYLFWRQPCFEQFGPRACFSKVPKLFGRISGDIISSCLQSESVSRHQTLQLF